MFCYSATRGVSVCCVGMRLLFSESIYGRVQTICALEWQHPAGVFGRESAYFVQLSDLVCGELEIDRSDVVLKLVQALGSNDDGGDDRFGQ